MNKLLRILIFVFALSFSILPAFADVSFNKIVENIKKNDYIDTARLKDFKKSLKREELAYISVRVYEIIKNKKLEKGKVYFYDTYDPYVLAAKNYGILDGYDDGTFRPEEVVSRQDLAVCATKILKIFRQSVAVEVDKKFSDDKEISSLLKKSCYFVSSKGIVPSKSNKFMPTKDATKQDAIIAFYKLIDILSKSKELGDYDEKSEISTEEDEEEYVEVDNKGDFTPTKLYYQETIPDEKQTGLKINSLDLTTIYGKQVKYKADSKLVLAFVDSKFSFSFDVIENVMKANTGRNFYVIDISSSNDSKNLYKKLGLDVVVFDKNKNVSKKFNISRFPSVFFVNEQGIIEESVYGICGVNVYAEAFYRTMDK